MHLPEHLKYSREHEWVEKKQGGVVRVGITDYAQDALGDIVFVELPETGEQFPAGEVFGSLESVKAVSDCYMPVSGTVKAVNEQLIDSPELINQDPYGEGWMVEVEIEDEQEFDGLLPAEEYREYLNTLEEGDE